MPSLSLNVGLNSGRKLPFGGGSSPLGLPTSFTMAITPSGDFENIAGVWIKETQNYAYAWPFNFYYRTSNSRLSEDSNYGMYGYIDNNWQFRGWDSENSELYLNTLPISQASTNQTSVPRTQIISYGPGDRTMTNS